MRNTLYLAAAASAALLTAGCNNTPETLNTVEADRNAPTTPLPSNVVLPTIQASKIYRCAYPSNAVYYVDFMNDNSVNIRAGSANATPTHLTGTSPTGPFTGANYTVNGNGNSVTINGQSCRSR